MSKKRSKPEKRDGGYGLKRSKTHRIDEQASRIFRTMIPAAWVLNELKPDYGKDYLVEMVDEDELLTGKTFYVQQKGIDKAKYTFGGAVVSFSMSRRHLTYFVDKVKMPVFLVVVDNAMGKVYWTWLQQYLMSVSDWRARSSATIRMPVANELSNFETFRGEVERAITHTRLTAVTVLERVAHSAKQVENVDPRFRAYPTVTLEKVEYRLEPQEPIELHFNVTDNEATVRFQELLDRGLPISFGPGELAITGSPLFEPFRRSGGTLQIGLKGAATASLKCFGPDDTVIGSFHNLPGDVTGGRREKQFQSQVSGLPFEFNTFTNGRSGQFRYKFDAIAWDGQRLLALSNFMKTGALIASLQATHRFTIDVFLNGKTFFTVAGMQKELRPVPRAFRTILQARTVADRFRLAPLLRVAELMQQDTVVAISTLNALATKGEASVSLTRAGTILADTDWARDNPDVVVANVTTDESHHVYTATLLGQHVPLGPYTMVHENVRIVFERSDLQEAVDTGKRKVAGLLIPTERTRSMIRLLGRS